MVFCCFSSDLTRSFSTLTNVLIALLSAKAENFIGCPKVAETIPFFCNDANN